MDPAPVDAVRAGLQPERDVYSAAAARLVLPHRARPAPDAGPAAAVPPGPGRAGGPGRRAGSGPERGPAGAGPPPRSWRPPSTAARRRRRWTLLLRPSHGDAPAADPRSRAAVAHRAPAAAKAPGAPAGGDAAGGCRRQSRSATGTAGRQRTGGRAGTCRRRRRQRGPARRSGSWPGSPRQMVRSSGSGVRGGRAVRRGRAAGAGAGASGCRTRTPVRPGAVGRPADRASGMPAATAGDARLTGGPGALDNAGARRGEPRNCGGPGEAAGTGRLRSAALQLGTARSCWTRSMLPDSPAAAADAGISGRLRDAGTCPGRLRHHA